MIWIKFVRIGVGPALVRAAKSVWWCDAERRSEERREGERESEGNAATTKREQLLRLRIRGGLQRELGSVKLLVGQSKEDYRRPNRSD